MKENRIARIGFFWKELELFKELFREVREELKSGSELFREVGGRIGIGIRIV